jgi:hypothetical protein
MAWILDAIFQCREGSTGPPLKNVMNFTVLLHNILEPTTGVTFFNSGCMSDSTELFPSIVLVIAS